jgi:hypothetical protein
MVVWLVVVLNGLAMFLMHKMMDVLGLKTSCSKHEQLLII